MRFLWGIQSVCGNLVFENIIGKRKRLLDKIYSFIVGAF